MDAQKTHFADDETLKHIDRLQAINAELVAALQSLYDECVAAAERAGTTWPLSGAAMELENKCRAALSKAKEA